MLPAYLNETIRRAHANRANLARLLGVLESLGRDASHISHAFLLSHITGWTRRVEYDASRLKYDLASLERELSERVANGNETTTQHGPSGRPSGDDTRSVQQRSKRDRRNKQDNG